MSFDDMMQPPDPEPTTEELSWWIMGEFGTPNLTDYKEIENMLPTIKDLSNEDLKTLGMGLAVIGSHLINVSNEINMSDERIKNDRHDED